MWLLNLVVGWLDLPVLKAPPGRSGDAVFQIEQRRLRQLTGQGVRVPQIVASGRQELLLSDLGTTLALRLRKADPDSAQRLFARTVAALADAHQRGAYLGQPQARNVVVDEEDRIGFIDFEEDPGEVMSLAQAQCRDWLLFASGTVRHLPFSDARVSEALAMGLARADPAVRSALAHNLRRLGWVRAISSRLGRRARGMASAIDALGAALNHAAQPLTPE